MRQYPITDGCSRRCVGSLVNQIDEATPLQLLSTSPWFDISGDSGQINMPVACVSGTTDTPVPQAGNCGQQEFCENGAAVPTNYVNCIRTTLGSVAGTSGGAMLMGATGFREDTSEFFRKDVYRHAYGVLNGSTAEGTEEDPDGWDGDSIVESDGGFPTEEHQTAVTLGDAAYVQWSKRTTTFEDSSQNLFQPGPKQPATDGEPSCEMIPGQGCVYGSVASNSIWGTPEADAPVKNFPAAILPQTALPGEPGVGEDGEPQETTAIETVVLSCDYNRYYGEEILKSTFRTRAGVAVGLIGTATDRYPDESTRVASLGVICAPYSTSSWTDNWNWVLKHMRVRWTGEEDTREQSAWMPILRLALPFMTEWRKELPQMEDYIRPMSMKTCPPNYLLAGVGIYHNATELTGITSLRCRNSDGDILTTPLKPSQGPAPGVWEYEFHDRRFSMEQRIGSPSPTGSTYEDLECPTDFVMSGIQVSKSSLAPVSHFHLACIEAPGTL